MNQIATTLASQARSLTPSARIELVDAILSSLDEPNQDLEQLWSQEAEERLAAYKRGEMKAIPLDEVLAKYRQP